MTSVSGYSNESSVHDELQKVELFLPAHCYIVEEPVRGAIKTGVGSGYA